MRRRRKNSWNLSPEFKERFKKEKFIRAHRIRISGIGTTCRKPNPKVCLEKVTRRRSKKFELASLYYRLYMGVRADRDISGGWTRMKSRWHGQVGPRLLPEQLRNRWIILSRDVRINLRHVKSVPRGYIYIYGRDREDNEPCALNGTGCGVRLPRGKRCFRSFLLGERGWIEYRVTDCVQRNGISYVIGRVLI